jgi:hypothetical protein
MKSSLGLAVLFAVNLVRANAAEVSATPAAINYEEAPVARFDYGLVRVWNAKSDPPDPPEGAGHVPEAKLGDALIAEVKNFDAWLCANLEAGAWANDIDAVDIDPFLRKVIRARTFSAAVRAGKWLRTKDNNSTATGEDEAAAEQKNVLLLAQLKTALKLEEKQLPNQDENAKPLDAANPKDAKLILNACRNALSFLTGFRWRTPFILSINDTRLPGLSVTLEEPRAKWRSANERIEEGDYTWWRIELRTSDDPELDKAWFDLMQGVAPHFSLQSRLSLSLPGELVALPTNVTVTAEDSRCRFVLIAVTKAPRVKKEMAQGDAVYPLDLHERSTEIRKGEIVELDDKTPATPYVVHFSEAGGTKHYASEELARLPPDPVPMGVVRVWNMDEKGTDWEEAQKNETPAAKIGDHLVVEVRNFDGWLCNQVDQGLLRDDPLIQKASKRLGELIAGKNFSNAVKVGGTIHDLTDNQNTSADIVRKLQKDAASNPDLAALSFPSLGPPIVFKMGGVKNAPSPTPPATSTPAATPTPKSTPKATVSTMATPSPVKEAARIDDETKAKQFLAPYQEAHSLLRELVKSKLRSLNLTINDLALGITPDNSDFTPIAESRRPFGKPKEDTYHWLRFAFAPKPIAALKGDEKATEDPFKRLLDKPAFMMPSKVTLTLKSGSETLTLPTAVTPQAKDKRCQFNLIGISQWMFWSITIVFAVIALSLGFFAAKTDILRDPCRRRPEGVEPVSLARTQMAFWFVVIAAAFLFLWVTTGNISTINGTCLVLLAIGTTTALTSAQINSGKDRKKDLSDALQKTPHEMLKMTPGEIQNAIAGRITELKQAAPATITAEEKAQDLEILERHHEEIKCFLERQPRWLPQTVYFWKYRLRSVFEDLLTEDAGTYDFQRFQILAWTLVLGTVFVVKVFYDRVMPAFDTNVLLLMGISSGAYLGFKKVATDRAKAPEKTDEKKTDAAAPVASQPQS